MKRVAFFAFLVFSLLACQKNEISLEEHDGYTLAIQTKGPVLGYSSAPTIMVKDLMFKDLNRSGALDPYEDWRLPAVERAEDLATRMSVEQICGLMIYSSAVTVEEPELSETQIKFLTEDNVRHVLVAGISSPGAGAAWANKVQALCESLPLSLIPFTEGAFKLKGKTKSASAVMPYYTISYGQDPSGQNVGNGFSKYIIQELLRDKYGFEGVVCTDWGIVKDYTVVWQHKGTPWGMETAGLAERRLMAFEAGCDQLGGVYDNGPSLEAYKLWEEKYGAESARERFELSARRLLLNIFRVGLFENPYVDPVRADEIVGCKEFVAAGYDAQLKSIVMLKNHGKALPISGRLKVWEPLRHVPAGLTHWMKPTEAYDEYPFSHELLSKYFDIAESPEEADFALVSIKTPYGHWGYILPGEGEKEGFYNPISLQWGPYTAEYAREVSLAGGDPSESSANRSYKGRAEYSSNEPDMYMVRDTRKAMGDKPVILVVHVDRPFVPAEVEPFADAILLGFGVSNNALLDVISGKFAPVGKLPCQLPADMRTVEEQFEDTPHDMRCYTDADGNTYDFAFGCL